MIPSDLYPIILNDVDIDTIQNFLMIKGMSLNFHFFYNKFKKDNIPIMSLKLNQKEKDWILEYKKVSIALNKSKSLLIHNYNKILIKHFGMLDQNSKIVFDIFPTDLFPSHYATDIFIISMYLRDRYHGPVGGRYGYRNFKEYIAYDSVGNHITLITDEHHINIEYLLLQLFYYASYIKCIDCGRLLEIVI